MGHDPCWFINNNNVFILVNHKQFIDWSFDDPKRFCSDRWFDNQNICQVHTVRLGKNPVGHLSVTPLAQLGCNGSGDAKQSSQSSVDSLTRK
jgi:hypothetical protein